MIHITSRSAHRFPVKTDDERNITTTDRDFRSYLKRFKTKKHNLISDISKKMCTDIFFIISSLA